jgi:acetyl-CoA C-acetyltransferase
MVKPIVNAGAVRTPLGAFRGELAGVAGPYLGAAAIATALGRAPRPG